WTSMAGLLRRRVLPVGHRRCVGSTPPAGGARPGLRVRVGGGGHPGHDRPPPSPVPGAGGSGVMTAFLGRLAERTLEVSGTIRPRLPSIFEPAGDSTGGWVGIAEEPDPSGAPQPPPAPGAPPRPALREGA